MCGVYSKQMMTGFNINVPYLLNILVSSVTIMKNINPKGTKVVGNITFVFLLRRPCLSALDTVYSFIRESYDRERVLPSVVQNELRVGTGRFGREATRSTCPSKLCRSCLKSKLLLAGRPRGSV